MHQRDLATLQSWSKVAGLEDVSGIGRYRTTIDLGADWTGDDGAYLELGEVNDTFRVRVNGELLPPCDPMDAVVDLGHALVPGVNQIEVEVASTLINRLRTVTPVVYGVAARQSYGLVGPSGWCRTPRRWCRPDAARPRSTSVMLMDHARDGEASTLTSSAILRLLAEGRRWTSSPAGWACPSARCGARPASACDKVGCETTIEAIVWAVRHELL